MLINKVLLNQRSTNSSKTEGIRKVTQVTHSEPTYIRCRHTNQLS